MYKNFVKFIPVKLVLKVFNNVMNLNPKYMNRKIIYYGTILQKLKIFYKKLKKLKFITNNIKRWNGNEK